MSESTYRRYALPTSYGLAAKYVERYAEANMKAQVEITRGTGTTRTAVYTGRARLHLLGTPVQMGFGDEPQYMVSGTLSVPLMTDDDTAPVIPQVNDMVQITLHRDPKVVGRSYRVMHVDSGGQLPGFVSMSVFGAEPSPTVTRTPPTTPVSDWPLREYLADE